MERLDRMASASGSITKLKMFGETVHPCRVPLEMVNYLDKRLEV